MHTFSETAHRLMRRSLSSSSCSKAARCPEPTSNLRALFDRQRLSLSVQSAVPRCLPQRVRREGPEGAQCLCRAECVGECRHRHLRSSAHQPGARQGGHSAALWKPFLGVELADGQVPAARADRPPHPVRDHYPRAAAVDSVPVHPRHRGLPTADHQILRCHWFLLAPLEEATLASSVQGVVAARSVLPSCCRFPYHCAVPAPGERGRRHPAVAVLPLLSRRYRDFGLRRALLGRMAHLARVVRIRARSTKGETRRWHDCHSVFAQKNRIDGYPIPRPACGRITILRQAVYAPLWGDMDAKMAVSCVVSMQGNRCHCYSTLHTLSTTDATW
ncbi:hypothetical protein L227DRAFT_99146 [Lentinus tigrinus ALCF2SS1-6]|uniref:Uncharacterized protein n=1 Tax=Lentinus tigrinus ALCF2SS1-6 TaxID=1328759 RepID=A0A5C2S962_9APHY|nr:hypothetical protein L227DRAFT_99146 [Lentinus tigrinus ALCF2SS1-6]